MFNVDRVCRLRYFRVYVTASVHVIYTRILCVCFVTIKNVLLSLHAFFVGIMGSVTHFSELEVTLPFQE